MKVIIAYLDTMFSAYPQTPRLLEAKTELQGMMEDAYSGLIAEGRSENEAVGQVIRDFGNLEEVAPVLGITAEIAPAPVVGVAAAGAGSGSGSTSHPTHPPVTLDEAKGYAEVQERSRFRAGLSVMCFVLSPSGVILLPTVASFGLLPASEGIWLFAGLLFLFVLVAAGVLLRVSISRHTAPYKRVVEGQFATNPEVTHWAEALRAQHEKARSRALTFAIACWILSPIPLIAASLLLEGTPHASLWTTLGVVCVLVLVATGLGILLPQSWAHSVAEQLGDGGKTSDDESSLVGVIAAFYWPLLVAIYLAWSLIGDAWSHSWIIWPIGGVLFGAIAAGSNALERYRRARR